MKRRLIALALGALAVAGWPTTQLLAQESKTARGTVTALAADSVTVKVGAQEMKFNVDAKTSVEATGAGTKAKQAQAAGQPGPKLSDVVKVGQPVAVSYSDMGGMLHATRIRAVASVGASGGGVAPETKTANGTVQSIAATSMTISGSSGSGATFTQTFGIDGTTKVIGRGAGTAAAAAGGKTAVTDLVGNGDKVSVSYHATGNTLHAAEIRVTAKGAPSK
jgi:Domain of unknown function (DUF5666)